MATNTKIVDPHLDWSEQVKSIRLEVDQEISNVVNPDQQTLTPTIAQRRVHSTVSVVSGQTVLLAGLISERSHGPPSRVRNSCRPGGNYSALVALTYAAACVAGVCRPISSAMFSE